MLPRLVLAWLLLAGIGFAQHPDDVFVGQKAPELKTGDAWINSNPLKLEQLRGKVILIDFWAWDCPFCAQAMPHIKELYDKYAKQGLVIIGVHTPRIDYEKDIPKIKQAVAKKGIKYPVVVRSEEHTSELQSRENLVCRLLLEKKKTDSCSSALRRRASG